ncbi:Oidioi.mRNA.OKI2018_I69.chr2.g4413.t1.cds [Oikopleura dioica]|uniref:Oidioi.mRNA.OKI2018_I69.chr2.g4413.t1.cds n=1 Tax=Oikopleura dioica TaxID=34765 RepID=A0ABN7SYU9_OIKDI|nr:Oidioi.mRNA.OKI2018_I69.chr2.g4413.t1.cds [Oikopleura dioica]
MLASQSGVRTYGDKTLVGNWVENRNRHNYRPSTRSYKSARTIYGGDFLPKIAPVDNETKAILMERSRGQTRSKTPACDLTTSYAYDFSPRKSRDERNWRIIHNEWGPEPAMTDMRETKGHLNWGLWERKKARMTAEEDVRKSDYQSHFKDWKLPRQTAPNRRHPDIPSAVTYDLNNSLSNMRLRNQRIMLAPDTTRPAYNQFQYDQK